MSTPATLLIVDDSTENLKLLGNSLKNAGFNILAALNGKQALALAESKQPDLILLDVMMPEMNGFEVCEALKENDLTYSIPVVFLTASVEPESIKTGFDTGAVDYILKPFNPDELILRIKNHLKQRSEKSNLERELRYKSYVLKNINNGIINPLSTLLKNSDLLSQNTCPKPFKSSLEQIQSSVTAIMKFTNNLGDLAEIDDHTSKACTEVFDLRELITSLSDSYGPVLKNKPHALKISQDDLDDTRYCGNKKKLRQALLQVLNIQLDHSGEQAVHLSVRLTERRDNSDILSIEIFSQPIKERADNSLLVNEPGLMAAAELLHFVDGRIRHVLKDEQVPVFLVELVLQRTNNPGKESNDEIVPHLLFSGKNILVVEDNELNQRLMSSVFQSYGANISIAHNGEVALEKAMENKYHIILMDVNVPLINGIEVTRILRTRYHVKTPIVAISGHSDKASIKNCIDAGMNSFLLKPFDISDLQNIVLCELEKAELPGIPFTLNAHEADINYEKQIVRYSLDKLKELGNGDPALINDWTERFRALISKGKQEIARTIQSNEYKTENKIFHELNNYTTYFGVELLKEYLKDLPEIRKNSGPEELMDHLRLIANELESIEEFFNEMEKEN